MWFVAQLDGCRVSCCNVVMAGVAVMVGVMVMTLMLSVLLLHFPSSISSSAAFFGLAHAVRVVVLLCLGSVACRGELRGCFVWLCSVDVPVICGSLSFRLKHGH